MYRSGLSGAAWFGATGRHSVVTMLKTFCHLFRGGLSYEAHYSTQPPFYGGKAQWLCIRKDLVKGPLELENQ